MRKVIDGGVLKLERVQVTCPACGQQVEAVAADGRVKGYCAAAKQYVDFPVTQGMAVPVGSQANAVASVTAATAVHTGKHPTVETRAKISAALSTPEARAKQSAASKKYWQDPEYQAKQTASHIDRHPTAETRVKISAANQGKHGTSKHLTAEHKAKISAAHMGKHLTAEHKAKIAASLRRRHNTKRG